MVRRSLAAGAGLLVLIFFVLGVRGCLDSRKESAINDWVRDVDALVKESNGQGESLFDQLNGASDGAADAAGGEVDTLNALNALRVQSEQLVDRARDLDRPDELDSAQQYVVETLSFRAEGIAKIADAMPDATADGDQQEGAADQIADAMQVFLTSDQIYVKRVLPSIDEVLQEQGLEQTLSKSTFLTDLSWIDPSEAASRIGGIASGGGADGDAAPGLHGNGLGAVTLGGQSLAPGGTATIPASDDLAFAVQVANQGENTETDVEVKVTIGSGSDAIEAKGVLDTIAAGETKTVEIPLTETPPTGQSVPIQVEVGKVPGEEKTDNNVAEFNAIFTS
jgi:hypothetical protein